MQERVGRPRVSKVDRGRPYPVELARRSPRLADHQLRHSRRVEVEVGVAARRAERVLGDVHEALLVQGVDVGHNVRGDDRVVL